VLGPLDRSSGQAAHVVVATRGIGICHEA
jgi:hypothetical protein